MAREISTLSLPPSFATPPDPHPPRAAAAAAAAAAGSRAGSLARVI